MYALEEELSMERGDKQSSASAVLATGFSSVAKWEDVAWGLCRQVDSPPPPSFEPDCSLYTGGEDNSVWLSCAMDWECSQVVPVLAYA